jgi:hypothetical protein
MSVQEKAPFTTDEQGKKPNNDWQPVVDEMTADHIKRLHAIMKNDAENSARAVKYINTVLGMINGSLKVELGVPNRIEDGEGETK